MNSWDQYHQSTPKLLPPTVFEKTNNNDANKDELTQNITQTSNHSIPEVVSNENYLISSENSETQLKKVSNELENLKLEILKLHSENDILRNKNKGNFSSIF